MHLPTAILVAAPLAVLAQTSAINVTKVETVDQTTREGDLAFGATNLAFGYSAGAGINFSNSKRAIFNHGGLLGRASLTFLILCFVETLGGGFNAGIPGASEGAIGGGWTLTADNLTFGFGGIYNNVSINVAIIGDKTTGLVSVTVNGKEIAL
ncbi:hypothetical protein BP6252_06287 [Coleophoma cylindrospora]|uniref:Uncharacterized protein n=1 Tax=Coleophoma cylindrospora TaxID=1849047 RepID=A0A3D8RM60_9HELO|nr:hypothetical protein BP6252_06287 [Coleophoma cylindrospora]